MVGDGERRKSRRYPVTLSARIDDATRSHRAEILDVSAGGLLVSAPQSFRAEPGAALLVDATMIGRIQARVIATSRHGIHLQVDDITEHYEAALRKISRLSSVWR